MASSATRRRARPKKKPNSRNRRFRYVDGFLLRNWLSPDIDVLETYHTSGGLREGRPTPAIPRGEVWLDEPFRRERSFLLAVHDLERRLRRRPYDEVREAMKRKLTRKGSPPPFILRTMRRGRLRIRFVRGDIVRRYFDPAFIFGGHDLIYGYIPKNEVWIDVLQDPREIPYTILHELHERRLMRRGATYAEAHRSATDTEWTRRRKVDRGRPGRPLDLVPFRQREAYCGPASLKIALSGFGLPYDELHLAKLAGTTFDAGTDHKGMIAAAKRLGATVFAKSGGTVGELRDIVLRRRLPVIVGWYSPTQRRKTSFDPAKDTVEDHFSVVYHVNRTHVFLMDPEWPGCRRKMALRRFLKLWWDTDTPKAITVRRWFMTLCFDPVLLPEAAG